MAKDVLGNTLKVGDTVIFNNTECIVKEIQENRLLGAHLSGTRSAQALKIPDSITFEFSLSYDADKPIGCFAVRKPEDLEKH